MLTVEEHILKKDDSVDITVLLSLLQITVKAGTFRRHGVDYALPADIIHNATIDATDTTTIVGHLVLNSGTPDVLVDEVVADGIDESYSFDDPNIVYLRILFVANNIPAGSTDLADAGINFRVFKITKDPS